MNLAVEIKKRRSIRKFTDRLGEKDKINLLLEAAMYAPSSANKQPWHFIVIDDRKMFLKIMEINPHSRMLETASHAILVCGDLTAQHGNGYWVADCGAATQNILLSATAIELGTCWFGIYPREDRMAAIKQLLSLPSHVEVFSCIAIGYPAEEKSTPERFDAEKIHFNSWNSLK
jgi:nitroreductase